MLPQGWVAGICAFHDSDSANFHRYQLSQLLLGAEIGPVCNHRPAITKRQQNFLPKTLVIHILTGLRQARLCPLLQPGEKIIHMKYAAVQIFLQPCRQRRFTGSTPTVNGDNESFLQS